MILQVPAMTILTDLTIAEARAGLRKGDFTAVELTRACWTAWRRIVT